MASTPTPAERPSDGDPSLMNRPAQSPSRSPADLLSPSAANPDAPGTPGMASEVPSDAATHRDKPAQQRPASSEHWFPIVDDDRSGDH